MENRRNKMGNRGGRLNESRSDRNVWRRKKLLWLVLLWILLIVNLFLLLKTHGKMRSMNEELSQVMGRVEVLEDESGIVPAADPADGETAANSKGQTAISAESYVDQVGLNQVDKPKKRTYREIISRLQELGKESSLIQQVADNARNYPEQLLEALANNPELQDFADHYLEKKGSVTGEGLTDNEKAQEFPLFLQWDPRWGYASYGDDSVVGLSGCGPTALSMVLWYLTGNEELTPDIIAEYSMKKGYYISGTGTAWLLLEDVPPLYGIWVSQPEADAFTMKQALDRGDIIILSMGPGDFTIGGHFIVVYGYTEEGFLINDPNCVARSRRTWTWEELKDQTKHMWVFSKESPVNTVWPQVKFYEVQ